MPQRIAPDATSCYLTAQPPPEHCHANQSWSLTKSFCPGACGPATLSCVNRDASGKDTCSCRVSILLQIALMPLMPETTVFPLTTAAQVSLLAELGARSQKMYGLPMPDQHRTSRLWNHKHLLGIRVLTATLLRSCRQPQPTGCVLACVANL